MPPVNHQSQVDAAVADVDFENRKYQIEMETSHGKIRLDLLPEVAPGHCKNMIGLSRIGFYDGLTFHRVIDGFMIQGGCPNGNGTGGPGYNVQAEFNATPHIAGVLSMARSSDPDSAGSQFFICLGTHKHLDGKYTAFGRTSDAESMKVVAAIGDVQTGANDRPRKEVKISKATVIEK